MFIRNCWYVASWDNEVPADFGLSQFRRVVQQMPDAESNEMEP